MVDIKRQDITLSDWTKGISADEFAWGSYYYSDGIQTWYSTKGFKLWPRVATSNLNERTTWWTVAVCPCNWSLLDSSPNFVAFTNDGRLEMGGALNGSTYGNWWDWWWGAVYNEYGNTKRVWWYVYWDYALAFTKNAIKKIEFKNTYNIEYGQTITNPRFENSASWWTVGTWWTLTDDWMEHTTWETGTLSVSAPWYDDGRWRLAFKVVDCTAWAVTLDVDWTDIITSEAWRDWWFVGTALNITSWQNVTITLTPSSDFNWIIEAVNFNVYGDIDNISWVTDANKHLAIEWGWDIYISSWNKIDILSTVDRTISDTKELCWEDEEIVWLTQQADSLLIWSTNWIDSFQYYWNGVDSIASECIRWQWQVIRAATGTEIVTYVLAGSNSSSGGKAYRLYSVSWYQRSLIASNAYKLQWTSWNLEHYHPSKKFAFNDVEGSESMCIYLDNLYLPWCDWIYQFGQTIPWLSNSWSRPIKYQNNSDRLQLFQYGWFLAFLYRNSQRTYYSVVESDEYGDSGYLVTDSIYWDKIGTRKAIEKLKLWYKSIPSNAGNIKIYAIVDDDYFWRFDVSWVTNRPNIWDVYTVANNTTAEIININKTSSSEWEITFRTVNNGWSLNRASRYLTKVSGEWDNQLDSQNNYDNMCLIKTIETEKQEYGADLIFGKNFVDSFMPYRHKIQLVIEITKKNVASNNYRTPEIYELSMVSDITDVTL